MTTPAECRNASHCLAHVSGMMRKASAPSDKEWSHLLSLFKADDVLGVSNLLISVAQKIETQDATIKLSPHVERAVSEYARRTKTTTQAAANELLAEYLGKAAA